MKTVLRLVLILLLLGVAAFCAFGFLASFEPHDGNWLPWQLLYAAFALAALFGIARTTRTLLVSK